MPSQGQALRILLCGDVMTGRGIDQVLPHPVPPVLYEDAVRDAREYVELAERMNGPIPRPVDFRYPWGDAADAFLGPETDVRIINLETSLTSSEAAWPRKGINYRMHPRNVGCLTSARIDCCSLANNHVLDWGYDGLAETIQTLDSVGIAHAGAGRNEAEAASPAVLNLPGKGRVLVYSFGTTTSGIPPEWGATMDRAGVNLLRELSDETASRLTGRMRQAKRPGDVIVASVHWGPNWDYEIPREHIRFAQRLVEGGVDIVHGHSSHHMKAIDVYLDRLILYGCGDFLDDYEGIGGFEEFRPDLRLLYLIRVDTQRGRLLEARLAPFQMRRFRLNRASETDVAWSCQLLNELGSSFGTRVEREPDNRLILQWNEPPRGE